MEGPRVAPMIALNARDYLLANVSRPDRDGYESLVRHLDDRAFLDGAWEREALFEWMITPQLDESCCTSDAFVPMTKADSPTHFVSQQHRLQREPSNAAHPNLVATAQAAVAGKYLLWVDYFLSPIGH